MWLGYWFWTFLELGFLGIKVKQQKAHFFEAQPTHKRECECVFQLMQMDLEIRILKPFNIAIFPWNALKSVCG